MRTAPGQRTPVVRMQLPRMALFLGQLASNELSEAAGGDRSALIAKAASWQCHVSGMPGRGPRCIG